ncbi:hypothetical protein LXL04_016683 [Taraxacum kok-saghyz]
MGRPICNKFKGRKGDILGATSSRHILSHTGKTLADQTGRHHLPSPFSRFVLFISIFLCSFDGSATGCEEDITQGRLKSRRAVCARNRKTTVGEDDRHRSTSSLRFSPGLQVFSRFGKEQRTRELERGLCTCVGARNRRTMPERELRRLVRFETESSEHERETRKQRVVAGSSFPPSDSETSTGAPVDTRRVKPFNHRHSLLSFHRDAPPGTTTECCCHKTTIKRKVVAVRKEWRERETVAGNLITTVTPPELRCCC